MKLTENFTLDELTRTSTGIPNTPGRFELINLQILAEHLQKIRDYVQKPVRVASGFRCEAVNKAVGGSQTSAHLKGYAADIQISGMTNAEIIAVIKKLGRKYDQVIDENVGNSTWVHYSIAPTYRMQHLVYKNGKYSKGE